MSGDNYIIGVVVGTVIGFVLVFSYMLVCMWVDVHTNFYEGDVVSGRYVGYAVFVDVDECRVFCSLAVDSGQLHGFWVYDNSSFELDKFFSFYGNVLDGYMGFDVVFDLEDSVIVGVVV